MTYLPPSNGVLEGLGPQADGQLLVMGLIALAFLLAVYGTLLWAINSTQRTQGMLRCPVDGRIARVRMLLGPAGEAVDVRRCSLQGRRVTCRKTCLQAA